MKKLIFPLLLVVLCSCNFEKEKADFNKVFAGNHELRRLSKQEKTIPSSFSADYFLFFGGASGKGEEKIPSIAFSWKSNNDEYILSRVELRNVRIKFDESTKVPYVTFGYDDDEYQNTMGNANNQINNEVEYRFRYIVIHCKSADYSPNINIQNIDQ